MLLAYTRLIISACGAPT